MRIQLSEKGEAIVGDIGMTAKLLIKNSDVHEVRHRFYRSNSIRN